LARGGYRTDAVVSGAYLHQNFGFERGFHTYRTLVRPRVTETIDAALEVLDLSQEVSRFLFIHIIDPHWHYLPPVDFVDRFGPEPPHIDRLLDKVIERKPPSGPEEIQALINLYDGELAYVDQQIGRLLDELGSRGLFDPSLIIITADHGEAFYEHGYWQHTETLYEEMIRIPLIVKWPQQSSPARVPELVSQLDIFPTVLEAAGLPTPPVQGRALAQAASQKSRDPRTSIISETIWQSSDRDHLKVAIRTGDLKYIATFSTEGDDRFAVAEMLLEELFDLATDPKEKHNRIKSQEAEGFRRSLQNYLERARAFRADLQEGSPVVMEEETIERLRKLGYIQ
jgi:arylsulfatase A-like enzyme